VKNYHKSQNRPHPAEALIGKKFGVVEVVRLSCRMVKKTCKKYPYKLTTVVGRCECGKEWEIAPGNLALLRSCGCKKKELNAPYHFKKTHGLSKNRHYDRWISMIDRCYNIRHKQYKDYGGRGIDVCDRWKDSFANFLEDMEASYAEGLTLDRIDNDKGYGPDNCKWATWTEQHANTRATKEAITPVDAFLSAAKKKPLAETS
jgi:hypothetical protein